MARGKAGGDGTNGDPGNPRTDLKSHQAGPAQPHGIRHAQNALTGTYYPPFDDWVRKNRMPEDDLDEDLLDEEADVPDDLDEADLEDLTEEDLDEEPLDDDALEGDDVVDDDLVDDVVEKPVPVVRDDDDDDDDDEDDASDDDVEASLDVILKERMVVADDEEEDDEEAADGEDRTDSPLKVLPKQPGEFVCQSCFLVKHPSQLADKERTLCRDCV
jgi:hypothetical protein